MKKFLSIILVVLLTGILPVYAAALEFTPNEIITAGLPSDWYMDESRKLYNADGVIGYADGKSYEEPLTDINKASLDFLKSKLLNNIMLIENIGTGVHIYEADTTSGTAFVFTVINESLDYMFIMCVQQSRISYTEFRNLAQSVLIEFIPGEIIEEEEIAEEVIEEISEETSEEAGVEIEAETEEAIEEIAEEIPEEPKPGNSIGNILSTDIITYIDNMPVVSYNVDGKTVVIVEDLVKFGFKVMWNPEARKLIVSTDKLPAIFPEYVNETAHLPIGTPVGEIYQTDIVTEINGREYESYNMNGQTVVVIEALGDRMIDTEINIYNPYKFSSGGFMTLWDEVERTLRLYCIRPGSNIDTWAGSAPIKEKDVVMKPVQYTLSYYVAGNDFISTIEMNGHTYIDLQKYLELKNVTCTFEKGTSLKVDLTNKNEDIIGFDTIFSSDVKTDMLLPLNLILTNGKSSLRSNNSNIAYYYKNGAIMVDINAVKNIIG